VGTDRIFDEYLWRLAGNYILKMRKRYKFMQGWELRVWSFLKGLVNSG